MAQSHGTLLAIASICLWFLPQRLVYNERCLLVTIKLRLIIFQWCQSLFLDYFIVFSFHTVVMFFKMLSDSDSLKLSTQKAAEGGRDIESVDSDDGQFWCPHSLVINLHMPARLSAHFKNTQSTCLIVFSDGQESDRHHYMHSGAHLDDWFKLTCAQLTAHTNTPCRLVWRCHQPAMWKTVRWSLVVLRGRRSGELNVPLYPPTPTGHIWWMDR